MWQISGTPERPRLCVFRSNKHIYAQVVDDEAQCTLAHATTLQTAVKGQIEGNCCTKVATHRGCFLVVSIFTGLVWRQTSGGGGACGQGDCQAMRREGN